MLDKVIDTVAVAWCRNVSAGELRTVVLCDVAVLCWVCCVMCAVCAVVSVVVTGPRAGRPYSANILGTYSLGRSGVRVPHRCDDTSNVRR
jgi:hypothetical protein